MAEEQGKKEESTEKVVALQTMYIKDISFEAPNSPDVFLETDISPVKDPSCSDETFWDPNSIKLDELDKDVGDKDINEGHIINLLFEIAKSLDFNLFKNWLDSSKDLFIFQFAIQNDFLLFI